MMRATFTTSLAGLFAILATVSAARAVEIVVDPGGRDTNPGTSAAPVQTLRRAQELARAEIAADPKEPVTVTLRQGSYRLTEPLEFGVADGGSEARRVEWRAARGQHVIVTGGVPITGWRDMGGNLWAAPLPEVGDPDWTFRTFYVNGASVPRASHPNTSYLRVQEAGPDRRTSFATAPNSFPRLTPGADVELLFLHDWSVSRIPILQADSGTGMVHLPDHVGDSLKHFFIGGHEEHPRFKLENDPKFLDAAGEWIIDRSARRILYHPRPQDRIETLRGVAPLAGALMIARGDPKRSRPLQNLHFDGIKFLHTSWNPPAAGYAGTQATFHEIRDPARDRGIERIIPAAVSLEFAENCSVSNCIFRNLGTAAMAFGARCRSCTLAQCLISNVAANGVNIGEGTQRTISGKPWWTAAPKQVTAGTHVHDCIIERCGTEYFGAVGIWAGITAGTHIERNLLRDLPYSGVSVGWRWDPTPTPARDNHVTNNHIERVMQILSDGGGVYTLGNQPRMAIVGNLIQDIPASAGRAESNGMFLDQGSTGLNIQYNAILNVVDSPIRFNKGGANTIQENLLQTRPGTPAIKYGSTPEATIRLHRNAIVTGPLPREAQIPPNGPSPAALEYFERLGGSR